MSLLPERSGSPIDGRFLGRIYNRDDFASFRNFDRFTGDPDFFDKSKALGFELANRYGFHIVILLDQLILALTLRKGSMTVP